MPPPISDTTKDRVSTHIRNGLPTDAIAQSEGISSPSVGRIRRNINKYGFHTPPPEAFKKRGPASHIHPMARESLRRFLLSKPSSTQKEISKFLLERWSLSVGQSCISLCLKQMKYKQISKPRVAAKRSPTCQTESNAVTIDIQQQVHDDSWHLSNIGHLITNQLASMNNAKGPT